MDSDAICQKGVCFLRHYYSKEFSDNGIPVKGRKKIQILHTKINLQKPGSMVKAQVSQTEGQWFDFPPVRLFFFFLFYFLFQPFSSIFIASISFSFFFSYIFFPSIYFPFYPVFLLYFFPPFLSLFFSLSPPPPPPPPTFFSLCVPQGPLENMNANIESSTDFDTTSQIISGHFL